MLQVRHNVECLSLQLGTDYRFLHEDGRVLFFTSRFFGVCLCVCLCVKISCLEKPKMRWFQVVNLPIAAGHSAHP